MTTWTIETMRIRYSMGTIGVPIIQVFLIPKTTVLNVTLYQKLSIVKNHRWYHPPIAFQFGTHIRYSVGSAETI